MAVNINSIFKNAASSGASDVHLTVGSPVMVRIDGELQSQGSEKITSAKMKSILSTLLGSSRMKQFAAAKEMDFSHSAGKDLRLRINAHYTLGNPGIVARIIPSEIPSLEDLHLEEIAALLCCQQDGLILFTGPTGAGKSTSLASMIAHIIEERPVHAVTIEDPIEFVYPSGAGLTRQRELGEDFHTFPEALKHVLRQDPDIILIGEMRDPETIALALTAAETGHLVFATLHTPNAIQSVDRIVDAFPPDQQRQVRGQLSLSLRAIVAQRLVPGVDGGRIVHREVLINTPAVANVIREGRTVELTSVLHTNSKSGMCTFDQDLKRLYKEGHITKEFWEETKGAME